MRKMKYFNKKAIVALGICCGLAGYVFMNHRSEASAADADTNIGGMDIGYHQCENNMEEILDEDVSETISIQVIDLQEKGETYQVSDAVELENGYYHHIEKEGGHSVVAGISVDDKNYVVTMDFDKMISDEEVKEAIEELQEKLA